MTAYNDRDIFCIRHGLIENLSDTVIRVCHVHPSEVCGDVLPAQEIVMMRMSSW